MKYQEGDVVRIVDPKHTYHSCLGIISRITNKKIHIAIPIPNSRKTPGGKLKYIYTTVIRAEIRKCNK